MLLEEFWYGNVLPQEQYIIHHPEIDELQLLIERNLATLTKTLTDDQ